MTQVEDSTNLPSSKCGASSNNNLAKSWKHRFSLESLCESASPLKESAKNLDGQNSVLLGAARPHSQFYPWQSIKMHATKEAELGWDGDGMNMSCARGRGPFDLADALNYGLTSGEPQLVHFFKSHVRDTHNPLYRDWDTCLSCGSTAAIDIALRMFTSRGHSILVEQFTYTGTMIAARKQGLTTVGIKMDEYGLDPYDLDRVLTNWDSRLGKKPFVLYTIPSGQNPTGTTQPTWRKTQIYEVAENHDLFIIEDDPYYLLSLEPEHGLALPASYLSLDTTGRVLRLDSASKILAPGLRAGWVTGCAQVIDLYVSFADVCTLAPSGPTQAMLVELLVKAWGKDGLSAWISSLSSSYRTRRDIVLVACEKFLDKSICQWSQPEVGMFLWIRLNAEHHQAWGAIQHGDEEQRRQFCKKIEDTICQSAEEAGVIIAQGSWFAAGDLVSNSVYFRLSYVTAPEEALAGAVEKFSHCIDLEFGSSSL